MANTCFETSMHLCWQCLFKLMKFKSNTQISNNDSQEKQNLQTLQTLKTLQTFYKLCKTFTKLNLTFSHCCNCCHTQLCDRRNHHRWQNIFWLFSSNKACLPWSGLANSWSSSDIVCKHPPQSQKYQVSNSIQPS